MYLTTWIVIGMKLKRRVIMLLPLLFITGYFTELTSAGIITIDIGLYWDEECTNPVSFIDLGMSASGQSRYVTFWLRNYSTDKGTISWGSNNFDPSSDGISEYWERKVGRFRYISNWNKKMKTEDLWEVRYTILLDQDIQDGVYSWDLIVRYNPSHSSWVISLSVVCLLTVAL